ncbi:ribonuclease II, chloroplastic/mitochondrial [Selaginella moellendorffii]|nr:ribonuclease II, chloroplastic/mitochondrial [Selaginella moellendorffii]|eukprot:XP_002968392.2 ribonuclease II, chloroplastic/mitochondrial [Selaginella moellendorffii]
MGRFCAACLSSALHATMAMVPSSGRGIDRVAAAGVVSSSRRDSSSRRVLLGRRGNRRSFTTSSAMRGGIEGPWSSSYGLLSRKWSDGLASLKQLVGLFVETGETKKERIRGRYLELRVSASEEVATSGDQIFRKGMLVELVKDGKLVCAVVDRPEGKKNWIAIDQYGNSHSVKPGKVRYVVPDVETFKPEDIVEFLKQTEAIQDLSLIEIAWHELVESEEKSISSKKLAKVLFGDVSHVEYYATHCMLSSKQVFFRRKQKGPVVFYEPRSSAEVQELQHQYNVEETARMELVNFINMVKSALARSHDSKPSPTSWSSEKFALARVEALQEFALDAFADETQKNLAKEVLEALGQQKSPESALDVLIGIGILPFHVNVELLKSKIPTAFPDEHIAAAKLLEEEPCLDQNKDSRVDLTAMKVYTIDSDSTEEIDDGLSATELPDGRVKIWIHIADPTRWVEPEHIIEREAKHRGTTVYLPEKTIPMFPMNLATGPMSLRQNTECCAVSVSVILDKDGSIAESSVCSSVIKPSMRLSYDSATELIMYQLDEERELNLLAKAARLRYEWRLSQGAVDLSTRQIEVKVTNPDSFEPEIKLQVIDMTSPSGQLVSEMMILCGEAIAAYGNEKILALPYRGQSDMAVEMNCTKPLQHSSLGLPGYVQFTSPIRRYSDLLAHYQVKAALRKKSPPLSSSQLEAAIMLANLKTKEARKLGNASSRYWLIEYLRRRPRDELYEASVVRVKDGQVVVSIKEVGLHTSVSTNVKLEAGDAVRVIVAAANPRKDILDVELVEVLNTEDALDNVVAA